MKLITAIIKPFMLDEVREAVLNAGVGGLTTSEIKGFDRQKSHVKLYRGGDYDVPFVVKVMLEVAVADDAAAMVVETIRSAANTGKVGDGKIFVVGLDDVTRIRTGETGAQAV